ncbi:hypothetical protein RO3G_04653 [Rhizopus delemar RA 99-880]|uniref:Uncharacterized protein n=1 Tax=Rhizopus delemar (strain RA 99-880 / ATCC MYA-4621 / FGSC 9543 / NRRL 43880) TaxID=246409 RepID=I1BUR8_RHIO9|nr:hypothetical protein RO3G_04653 [Rhizopus delemar RA 99-880]|eukprot:EIE79948.1 hypothetical protein RO3G_04653 [Rhizopus delemar RA 99-880]
MTITYRIIIKSCASSIPENELLAPTAENDSNINATSILKRDIKLELDSLRHLKRSINAINDYEFLTDINSRDKSRRMETQRSSNS